MKTIIPGVITVALAISPIVAAQDPSNDRGNSRERTITGSLAFLQEPQPPDKPKEKPKPEPPDKSKPQPKQEPQQQPKQEPKQQPQEKPKEKQQSKEAEKNTKKQSQKQAAQQSRSSTHTKGQRIPPAKFDANFGRQHQFRVHNLQDGRRFHSSGYWFELVEVWPADWSYDDECYIEEDGDDYYLVNLVHPTTRVLVIVVEG